MDLILKNRNGTRLSERQRSHIEQKLGKLSRFMEPLSIEVELSSEQRQNQGEVYRMQATLIGEKGVIVRADQSAGDVYSVTDLVQEVLQRQIKRYKEKHWRRGRLRRKGDEFIVADPALMGVSSAAEAAVSAEEPEDRHMVRVKEFPVKPMFSDEAVEQMELLDHNFFVFRDADTSRISVVYRRRDGNYGMIIPTDEE
jgi:ribosomal subunit interface protein